MTFCPHCGASLKGVPSGQAAPVQPYRKKDEKAEKNEKNEKQEKNDNQEKQEKGERGFIGYLIGGLILITIGLFSVIQISNPNLVGSGQSWALMLLIIGLIIIAGAIYVALIARKHSPTPR
jgi:cation transport ATPase